MRGEKNPGVIISLYKVSNGSFSCLSSQLLLTIFICLHSDCIFINTGIHLIFLRFPAFKSSVAEKNRMDSGNSILNMAYEVLGKKFNLQGKKTNT